MADETPLYGPSTAHEAEDLLHQERFNHYMSMFMGWRQDGVTHQQKVDTLLSQDFKERITRIMALSGVSDLLVWQCYLAGISRRLDSVRYHQWLCMFCVPARRSSSIQSILAYTAWPARRVPEPRSEPDRLAPPDSDGVSDHEAHIVTSSINKDEDKPSLPYTIELDPIKAAHPIDIKLVFTTIPPKVAGEPLVADGYTSCIIRPPALSSILKFPDYPQPVPKLTSTPAYEVRATSDKGPGVFSTRDIKAGEVIAAERPILLSHRFGMRPSAFGEKEINEEWEKQLKIALEGMSARDQVEFPRLSIRQVTGDGDGIFKSNAIMLEDVYDGLLKGREFAYGGIFPVASRINKSSRPNVALQFSRTSFSMQYVAKVDIKAGDQLLRDNELSMEKNWA